MEEVFSPMEVTQTACCNTGHAINMIPLMIAAGATLASAESSLFGGFGNQYSLGGTLRSRISIDSTAMRAVWARACEQSVDSSFLLRSGNFPLLFLEHHGKFGALTAQLKCCYTPANNLRHKVVLDLDGFDNSKPFPTCDEIYAACAKMMQENTEPARDWSTEACVVFFLSMPGKERSAHVYFPNVCFFADQANQLGKAHPLQKIFNDILTPLGLQGDFSICNSGIRWAFGDKYLPNENNGRHRVAIPTFFNFPSHFDLDAIPWKVVADIIDPHMLPDDQSWEHQISWIIPVNEQPLQRRAAGQGDAPIRTIVNNAPAAEQRLFDRVPTLVGVPMRRQSAKNGSVKLEPQTNWCPFKMEPSDNQPAHQHASPKLYAFCFANGTCKLFCGVCQGSSIAIAAPVLENDAHREIITRFNMRFARINSDRVLKLPVQLANGNFHPYELLSLRSFVASEKTLAPKIKTPIGKLCDAEYWYHSEHSRRYPFGLIFDPSMTCDGNYYNTFTGLNPAMLAMAESMQTLTDDQLAAEWSNTAKLIRYNMCSNDEPSYNALIGWYRDIILMPGRKPGWGVAAYGPQGCGKGLSAQFMLTIIGRIHGVQGDSQTLTGAFNYGILESIMIFADEAVADTDEKAISQLKKYITETETVARRKYCDERTVNTVMRVFCASNNNPVFLENKDRRWLCLNADYALGNEENQEWRELCVQVVRERESLRGPAAFYLLAVRNGNAGFDHLKPIRNRARWDLKFKEFSPFERFVYQFLSTGVVCTHFEEDAARNYTLIATANNTDVQGLCDIVWNEGAELPKRLMWAGFCEMGDKRSGGFENKFWSYLYSIFPNKEEAWSLCRHRQFNRCPTFIMPERELFKQAFCEHLGQSPEIFTEWKHE